MTELTSRQRLLRAIRHEETDRVPISPRYFDYLLGVKGCCCVHHCLWLATQYDHDLMPTYHTVQNNYLLNYFGPYNDLPGVRVNLEIADGGDGVTVRRRFDTPAGALTDQRVASRPEDASGYDLVGEPLVKGRADLERVSFLLPQPRHAYIGEIPLLREAIGEKGLLLVKAGQGVDQSLMDAVGVQGAMVMYYDDRELLQGLLRVFQDHHRDILRRVLEQGTEVIFEPWYSSSMSQGWSPEQFRELFLPLIKENIELVHSYDAYVDYYDDGKMDAVLEDLADAGADIVETLAPPPLGDVDLSSAKRRIGGRACLKGHVDQVNSVCFGTPEQIREAVRQAIEGAARGSGFILGTVDSIRPETPRENIKAYFDAAHEFARLDRSS